MYASDNPLLKFEKIGNSWHLSDHNGIAVDAEILGFNIDLYTNLGYIKNISKIVWDNNEFCFYFEGDNEPFNIEEYDLETNARLSLESLKCIALSIAFTSDGKIGEEFAEEMFNFNDED